MAIPLLSPCPCYYGTEYFATLDAENRATRAVNAASLRRKNATAHVVRLGAQPSSPHFHRATSTMLSEIATVLALLDILDAATRARKAAQEKCELHPLLLPVPSCASLVFPAPFPVPCRHRAATQLPCPNLWNVLEIAAATRASLNAPPAYTALCLPADAAADKELVRGRFRRLAKLLHPDRWPITWTAAQESVPVAWAAVLDASAGGDTWAGSSSCGGYRRWTTADVRAATEAAFLGVREAYEALCGKHVQAG